MGYEALYFARLHYLEKQGRLANKSLEFIWDASDDLSEIALGILMVFSETNLLTGAFFQDNYGPPPGFCFDQFCDDDPIIDTQIFPGYNVDEKVKAFVDHVKNQVQLSLEREN